MNKKALSSEFIFQLFSLVIAVLLVHAVYVTVVQPNASEALIEEAILINEDPAYVPERNLFVVVKIWSKRHALFSCCGRSHSCPLKRGRRSASALSSAGI